MVRIVRQIWSSLEELRILVLILENRMVTLTKAKQNPNEVTKCER